MNRNITTMKISLALIVFLVSHLSFAQKKYSPEQIESLKKEVIEIVQQNHKMSQVMVDKIFSFAELGFQEVESSKYLTGILEQNGFKIERGTSGIPRKRSGRPFYQSRGIARSPEQYA